MSKQFCTLPPRWLRRSIHMLALQAQQPESGCSNIDYKHSVRQKQRENGRSFARLCRGGCQTCRRQLRLEPARVRILSASRLGDLKKQDSAKTRCEEKHRGRRNVRSGRQTSLLETWLASMPRTFGYGQQQATRFACQTLHRQKQSQNMPAKKLKAKSSKHEALR